MQKLTGLWKNTSKNGTTYYSGKVGNTRFLLFKNDKGDNERAPDLQLSIAKVDDNAEWTMIPETDEDRVERAARQAVANSKRGVDSDDLSEEIPF